MTNNNDGQFDKDDLTLLPWDITDGLDSEEVIIEYLRQVREDGDPEEMACAEKHVTRAREKNAQKKAE